MSSAGDRLHSLIDSHTREPRRVHSEMQERCVVCSGSLSAYAVFGERPLLLHCPNCGTQRLWPVPTAPELAAYYSGYGTTRASASILRAQTALAKSGLQHSLKTAGLAPDALQGARFFEAAFGCGSSLFASAELGARVFGLDIDPEAVARAEQYAAEQGYVVELRQGQVETLQGHDAEFDVVRASHVIEHTIDPRRFVRALHRVLRPAGLLLLECPNNKALVWLAKNALRSQLNRDNFYNALKVTEHLWGFNRHSLAKLLHHEGFHVRCVTDYSVANHRHQPDVACWYPAWAAALPSAVRHRSLRPLMYASVRTLDVWAHRLASGGMGLAIAAVRAA